MDKIDLEELERLHKAATPGPWKVGNWLNCVLHTNPAEYRRTFFIPGQPALSCSPQDAAYIVAACNSVPELIAENRELQERVRELEEYRDRLAHEAAYLAGAYPVLDCRVCDYSEFCPRNETRIEPDFDICKAAILNLCKPDTQETGSNGF